MTDMTAKADPCRNHAESLIRDYLDRIVDREYALAALRNLGGSMIEHPSVTHAIKVVSTYRQRSL